MRFCPGSLTLSVDYVHVYVHVQCTVITCMNSVVLASYPRPFR